MANKLQVRDEVCMQHNSFIAVVAINSSVITAIGFLVINLQVDSFDKTAIQDG